MLFAENNPVDGVVLKVILRKVREIKRSFGISMPFPEDSKSIMDAVLHSVLLQPQQVQQNLQMQLEFPETDPIRQNEIRATRAYEEAAEREKESRSIFKQSSIKDYEIEEDLKQTDLAIGDPKAVEAFVVQSLNDLLGVQIVRDKKGYVLYTTNLPDVLSSTLTEDDALKVSFESPTPEGYIYLGRNHLFVEQLCQYLLANSLSHNLRYGPARSAVIKCKEVESKTTILLFRVRNVIEEKSSKHQLVAEEMLLWGYRGNPSAQDFLSYEEAHDLLNKARPSEMMTPAARVSFLENELRNLPDLKDQFDQVAFERAENLVEAHERFRRVMGGTRHQVVEPVLPMDVMGIYILLPDRSAKL